MSFFDQASLVMIPSGYKTSKVYSIKPTDGSGDMAFSRSNDTATRVNSAGLIEKVRTNLVLQSQTFDNASWTKSAGATITANTTTAPDGTLTADTLNVATNVFSGVYQAISSSSNIYTISLFVKKGTKDFIYLFDIAAAGQGWFNLTNGTLGAIPVGYNASITSVGDGWYRISFGNKNAVTPAFFQLGLSDADGFSTPDTTGTAFIWGAQAEVSDFGATPYIATTTAAVSVGPVANVPRLDYLGSSCPRLLLEPQRTNLLPMSEQITNATFWNSAGGDLTATANVAVSPDGYTNADSITLANSSNRYYVSAPISLMAGTVYTYTVYMKSASGNLNIFMSGVNGLTGQMKTVTTEWQRFTLTFTMHANGSEYFGFDQRAAGASTSGTVYFWGAQVEAGAYATSYIPTLGAAVTRGADAASKTGISSIFGATATTYFMDVIIDNLNPSGGQWTLTAATDSNNFLSLSQFDAVTRTPRFAFFVGGSSVFDYTGSALTAGRHKIAAMVKNGSQKFYIDGVLIASNTGSGYTQFDKLALNDAVWASPIQRGQFPFNQVLIFPTELTNAQLAELTTI